MHKKEYWESTLSEDLPVDVLPCSNGEFAPRPPSPEQKAIMALANEETEKARRTLNMSRRNFVRTSAAMAIGIWSIGAITNGRWGRYAVAQEFPKNDACDLNWPGAQLNNMPGEFIFDVQSHHVDAGGEWRATNPGFHAFFTAIWSQSGPLGGMPGYSEEGGLRGFGYGGEIDPIENLSRYHYLKELYLDSSTNMCVLSAVPSAPDDQPLSIDEAALTVGTVNALAQNTPRSVMHAFVMPNRGVMIHNPRSVSAVAADVREPAERLIAAYWPGPMTLVLRAAPGLDWALGEAHRTVALRMPAEPVLLQVLYDAGPLACSAAGRTGDAPPQTVEDAHAALGDAVALYVDDGHRTAARSTIVDVREGELHVLREGAVSPPDVDRVAAGALPWGARPDPLGDPVVLVGDRSD